MPGIVSWPAVVRGSRSSWATVITSDFLPTVMEVLSVDRPASQSTNAGIACLCKSNRGDVVLLIWSMCACSEDWAIDGVSILPILRGEPAAFRCIGHNFNDEDGIDKGFRCGKWKLVHYHLPETNHTDQSCASSQCHGKFLLYNLETDIGEVRRVAVSAAPIPSSLRLFMALQRVDLSKSEPDVLASMKANASAWFASVERSIGPAESNCPARVVPPGILVPP